MKIVKVVAAIIKKDNRILTTQRGYGEFKGGWEFPGGKIEENECPQNALKREIFEELSVNIDINEYISTIEYDYPNFHLSMKCYVCSLLNENIVLKEHSNLRWLLIEELNNVEWLPADRVLVDILKNYFI